MTPTQHPHSTGLSDPGGVVNSRKILNVVVVLGGDDSVHRHLTYDLIREGLRGKYKKIEIYVISPLPSPLYLKQIRDLLLSNIHVGIVVRYSGNGAESLRKLLQELVKSGDDIRVYFPRSSRDEYLDVIEQFGITPILVGEGL